MARTRKPPAPKRPSEWQQAVAIAKKGKWPHAVIVDQQDVWATLEGCWFDPAAAQHAVDFFTRYLRHSKGRKWAGAPFILLPWEEDATRRIFGWKRADGTRRFRRGGVWVPKKNGKSTWVAGLELYMLIGDNEPGAEVYTGANDRGQAGNIYTEAANMVRQSPDLKKRLKPVDSTKTIAFPGMAGKLQALSADVETKEGLNAHAVFIDEIHAMKKRTFFSTLEYAGAAREQPLCPFTISTAGIYDETSIGWEQYQHAKRVLAGEIRDWAFFALIFEAGKDDDWTAPATWQKANPSFGITIDPQTFAQECEAAQSSPSKEADFKRYRLNMWVQSVTRAIEVEVWDAQRGHESRLEFDAYAGRQCDAGVDISSVNDLTVAIYGFECEDDEDAIDVLCRFWVPEARLLDKKNPNRMLYQQWVDEGYLETIPGNVIDYDIVAEQIIADAGLFQLRDLAIDRLFQGQHVSNKLTDEGVNVFPMGQGFLSMGPAYKEFERRLLNKKWHHAGHPILRWTMENVMVARDAHDNKKIVKPQGHLKVDGAVALVMMADRKRRHGTDEEETSSVYDDEGVFLVGDEPEVV